MNMLTKEQIEAMYWTLMEYTDHKQLRGLCDLAIHALRAQSKAAPQTRELPSNSPVDTHSVSRSAVAAPDSGREKPNYSAGLGGD